MRLKKTALPPQIKKWGEEEKFPSHHQLSQFKKMELKDEHYQHVFGQYNVGFSCMIVERPKMDMAERTDVVYLHPADMATLLMQPTATSPVYLVVGTVKYECLPHYAVDRFCVAVLHQQRISQNLALGDRIRCYPSS